MRFFGGTQCKAMAALTQKLATMLFKRKSRLNPVENTVGYFQPAKAGINRPMQHLAEAKIQNVTPVGILNFKTGKKLTCGYLGIDRR